MGPCQNTVFVTLVSFLTEFGEQGGKWIKQLFYHGFKSMLADSNADKKILVSLVFLLQRKADGNQGP